MLAKRRPARQCKCRVGIGVSDCCRGAALLASGVALPVAAQPAPPPPPVSGAASLLPAEPIRVVNIEALTERGAPDEDSEPVADEIDSVGRALRAAPVSYYPTRDPDAQVETLALNTQLTIDGTVEGDDGETWYRTADGDFLPAGSVRLPRQPPRTFAGRWIDVDLREPAMLVAYEGRQRHAAPCRRHTARANCCAAS